VQTKHRPNANRGSAIVAQGTPWGAPACGQCHTAIGRGDTSGRFPRIGGQPAAYLARQLMDFRSGARADTIMAPIAAALSDEDVEDVAAYYAGTQAPFLPQAGVDPRLAKKGRKLAQVGIAAKGIPACSVCHGAGGIGEPPAIPYLAGQYAYYTASELELWRRGLRRNSLQAMALFAGKLDEQEIRALAAYFQQAQPPSATGQLKE
jgi:cytochrome c553